MKKSKEGWICRIFGHHLKKIKEFKRGRAVYHCKRCSEKMVLRSNAPE